MMFAKSMAGLFKGISFGIVVLGFLAAGLVHLTTDPVVLAGTKRDGDLSRFKCSDRIIEGSFAVRGDGSVPSGPPGTPMVPFANVSLMTLDGAGNLTNDITVS